MAPVGAAAGTAAAATAPTAAGTAAAAAPSVAATLVEVPVFAGRFHFLQDKLHECGYTVGELLGEGSFGMVFACACLRPLLI